MGVSKRFERVMALHRMSFEVRNGEVAGYVEPNGTGKTNTIRIAVGVLPSDAGDVYIDGYPVPREKAWPLLELDGFLSLIFEQEFKILDYFMYLATCKGLSLSDARRLGRGLLEEVGLGDAANRKLSTFFPRYEEERSLKRSR
jgi:ABC-2 type transport system ATP-binding protein